MVMLFEMSIPLSVFTKPTTTLIIVSRTKPFNCIFFPSFNTDMFLDTGSSSNHNNIIMSRKIQIITGEINTGKTTFAEKVIERYRREGKTVEGVLSYGIHDNGVKIGFRIRDIGTGKCEILAVTPDRNGPTPPTAGVSPYPAPSPPPSAPPSTGRFIFYPEAFSFAEKVIKTGCSADVLVIDELGKIEIEGGGLFPAAQWACHNCSGILILVIRTNLVSSLLDKLELPPVGTPLPERRSSAPSRSYPSRPTIEIITAPPIPITDTTT